MTLYFNGKLPPKPLKEHHVHKSIIPQSRDDGCKVHSNEICRWQNHLLRSDIRELHQVLQLPFTQCSTVWWQYQRKLQAVGVLPDKQRELLSLKTFHFPSRLFVLQDDIQVVMPVDQLFSGFHFIFPEVNSSKDIKTRYQKCRYLRIYYLHRYPKFPIA